MNLRFVEAFIWVVRLGGVTRAAERLNLTQSAISSRIAALEEELGTSLIDRRAKGFRLTWAGERFLSFAERFLDLKRRMQLELGASEQEPFVLRIGAIETVLHSWLLDLVNRLKAENPRIALEITVEMTPVLNDYLRRGTLDLVFTAAPAHGEALLTRALPPMEMVLVGPAALADAPLSVEAVLAHELMTFQRGSQPHVALESVLQRLGRPGKRAHCLSSVSALVELAEGGFGLATLPRRTALSLARRYAIAILDTDLPLDPLPIFASHRPMEETPGLAQALERADALARAAEATPAARGVDFSPAPPFNTHDGDGVLAATGVAP